MYTGDAVVNRITLGFGKQSDVLGTIGSRAPFHSHKQNMATTANPEHSGARTMGEFHGKVTPPYRIRKVGIDELGVVMKDVPKSGARSREHIRRE